MRKAAVGPFERVERPATFERLVKRPAAGDKDEDVERGAARRKAGRGRRRLFGGRLAFSGPARSRLAAAADAASPGGGSASPVFAVACGGAFRAV